MKLGDFTKQLAVVLGSVALVLASARAAGAAAITFDNLAGNNGATFTSYVESGFTFNKTAGSGCIAQNFGNPVPDIFGGPQCDGNSSSTFVLSGGGLFSFTSVDLAANNGTLFYQFIGTLAGGSVFNYSGSLDSTPGVFVFVTHNSLNLGTIDTLTMNFRTAGSTFNVDNINAAAPTVPEPSTMALLTGGLAVLAARLRKRQA